jgi:hypothetical protein
MQKQIDPDLAQSNFVKTHWQPHQQKVEYKYHLDSSEIEDSESDNEDKR